MQWPPTLINRLFGLPRPLPVWFMRLFRLPRPVMEFPETPFLNYWPGEIVRHMGRPVGEGFMAGCIMDAGRKFVCIKWEPDPLSFADLTAEQALNWKPSIERITDPAVLLQIVKQPRPSLAQL